LGDPEGVDEDLREGGEDAAWRMRRRKGKRRNGKEKRRERREGRKGGRTHAGTLYTPQ
jgi:hypothetical protein